jgi:PAS domain S-box-containing protein
MHWQYTPYALPLLIAAAISAALALLAWRRRPALGATPLAWLMLAAVEWTLGYTLELGSADLSAEVFWAKVEYLGIVSVPIAWLALALQYTGRGRWLTRRSMILLTIVPLLTLLLVWTNDVHGLIWSDIRQDTSGSFSVLDLSYGAWWWVHTAYSYLLVLLGTVLLLQSLIRSPHLYRGQAGALVIGALATWVGNALYISGLSPFPHLDLTPFASTLTGLAMAWGLFRFRLLDIVPIARDAVIEGMSDGVIVLDAQNRIVDLNPAAERIIGYPASEIIGQSVDQALSVQPDLIERYRYVTEAHAEVVLGKGEEQRYFDLRISPLRDRQGHLTGRLVVVRDITERKREEGEKEALLTQLEDALTKVLSGYLPICANCKKIRNDDGAWHQIEAYIRDHTEVEFSHDLCPECAKKLYPEFYEEKE